LGAALARELGCGFVPVRKPGKLPGTTLFEEYALEYGRDRLELHADALPAGARVLVVDDVLATRGTLRAAVALLRRQGARVRGAARRRMSPRRNARRVGRFPAHGARCALIPHRSDRPRRRSPSPSRWPRCTWSGARPTSPSASRLKAAGRRC